ncbi:MAG: ribulose bisphosphate carboxylase small subunit [Acidimicrobiales bacterium]|jgi:ribulose-bisphosphate carboxylase small chain
MRLTQGTFSFLPDLTDEQITAQVQYCIDNGWAVNVEYTDDPHPRNTYWEMWGQPMFDLAIAAGAMMEFEKCREAHGNSYIRITAFDATGGWESLRTSFIVNRPAEEPGFALERSMSSGRTLGYTTRPYSADQPSGQRYQ